MVLELLKLLNVTQKKTQVNDLNTVEEVERLNPYNPLSYFVIVIYYVVAIVMYGVVGYKENIHANLFSWENRFPSDDPEYVQEEDDDLDFSKRWFILPFLAFGIRVDGSKQLDLFWLGLGTSIIFRKD